jgi:hypothetical protein
MFSLQNLYDIKETCRTIGYCDLTANFVYEYIYKSEIDIENVRVLKEEWEDLQDETHYSDYVVGEIIKELSNNYFCLVQLSNSSGEDKTFIHIFSLFLIDGDVYRLESYGKKFYNFDSREIEYISLYCSRIVEWPTYIDDLTKIINHRPGKERLSYWNGLFSANEENDTDCKLLEVELTVAPKS